MSKMKHVILMVTMMNSVIPKFLFNINANQRSWLMINETSSRNTNVNDACITPTKCDQL